MVGNCKSFNTPDFRVVANVPDATKSTTVADAPGGVPAVKNANYDKLDPNYVGEVWRDKYSNYILPVA
jgi:hypothetical protein